LIISEILIHWGIRAGFLDYDGSGFTRTTHNASFLGNFVNRTKANTIESMANSKTSTKPKYHVVPKPNYHLRI
jgi:hypothetical protein